MPEDPDTLWLVIPAEVDLDKLREGFMNMGRSYVVDPATNGVVTFAFPIPSLEKALSDVA